MARKLKLKNNSWKSIQTNSNMMIWNNIYKHLLIVLVFATILSILLTIKTLVPSSTSNIKDFVIKDIKLPQKAYASFLIVLMSISMFVIIKFSFNKSWLLFIPFLTYTAYIVYIMQTMIFKSSYNFDMKNLIEDLHIFFIIIINIFFYILNAILERKTNPFWVNIQLRRVVMWLIFIVIVSISKFLIIRYGILHKQFDITHTKTFWSILSLIISIIAFIWLKIYNDIRIHKTNQSIWLKNFKITGIIISLFAAFILFSFIRVFEWEETNQNKIFVSIVSTTSILSGGLILFGKYELKSSNIQISILNAASLVIWLTWFIMAKSFNRPLGEVNSVLIAATSVLFLEITIYFKGTTFRPLQKAIHTTSLQYSIFTIISFEILKQTGLNEIIQQINLAEMAEISLIIVQTIGFIISAIKLTFKTRTLSKWMKKDIRKKKKEVKHAK